MTPSSRLYTDFSHQHICADIDVDHWIGLCEAVETDIRAGLHAIILADYEWGAHMQLGHHQCPAQTGTLASFKFLLFHHCARLSKDQTDAWLAAQEDHASPPTAGIAHLRTSIHAAQFDTAFQRIQTALQSGEIYQANFTWHFHFSAFGSPFALYRHLRTRQPVPFGALIALPNDRWILSCSPELFVQHRADQFTARPMKGTAVRASDEAEDRRAAEQLATDPKNRAENLMIVDLLRNDLGRIALTGSVHVPTLFSVEPYARLWQMTSTVTATRRADVRFADVIRALFPCGSITGAPKIRALQWIDMLETLPRGLYTGAIGWLDAPTPVTEQNVGAAPSDQNRVECGDFCLSVAIRTVTLEAPRANGLRAGCLGVGAGIVLDSIAAQEYEECASKARFLTELDPGFTLIETMFATRAHGVRHLERHCARLAHSARVFDFKYERNAFDHALATVITALPAGIPHRLRLTLSKNGLIEIQTEPLIPLPEPVHILFAHDAGFAPVDPNEFWLHHKTTLRARHTRAVDAAGQHGAFDVLFLNTRGELTEGARSHVFLKLNGGWFTPPLASGLLPGVMRAVLLDDPEWHATERVLTQADADTAEKMIVCNAVRGVLKARLI